MSDMVALRANVGVVGGIRLARRPVKCGRIDTAAACRARSCAPCLRRVVLMSERFDTLRVSAHAASARDTLP
jgi:hypothetical protein